ncbi:GNAT family N-acetyltransferase [Candidatus Woesearchaeota archaeon]|nr:GNAT family N-acetyltransferase [Candidatus Woesearchaeota archaeon]
MKNPNKTILRPLRMSDLDNVMTWVNDKEVTKNLAKFNKKITKSQEKKFLKNLLKSKTDKVFSIEDENHTYVGQVGIHQIYWPAKNGRLGIIIGNKNAWGKGHASKALKL